MKENLMHYLKTFGQKSFTEAPFSAVDALVLSQLSYLKLEGIVPGFNRREARGWDELKAHPDAGRMFSDPVFGPMYREIFRLVSESVRYRRVRVNYFVERVDQERELQFAAVTFFLGETSVFVSFRGTDETLVGWKEDFNMGYMSSVPAQRLALAYLKGAARYTRGSLVLGGHSKGGNLAVFAAAGAPPAVQQRIRRVYSFDGPGLQKEFYQRPGFGRIEDRFCKIVPEQSLIGMLFANYRKYRVVESYHVGVAQHDLMHWKIRNGRFVYRQDLRRRSSRKAAVLNAWIDSLTREQISVFVEILYGLLCSTKARTVYELAKQPFLKLHTMIESFRRLDSGEKRAFWQIIGRLFQTVIHIIGNCFAFSYDAKASGRMRTDA